MTSSDIRQSFLDFFKEKKHTIVPSSSLLPDSPNLLFTNAGMNQFVPIFLGQAPCTYSPARAADTQKCIRAGGKHNDLEDVGFDTYHHTFFEMLGNWSFGDYFKKEAIEWAWELVVNRWKFPASRIHVTVYSPDPGDPASFDREAHEHWSEIFIAAGLDPAYHVVHGNKKDNFWMMGDTGPCGPCSELNVNLSPGPRDLDIRAQIDGRNLVNKSDPRCIEIWNLVFIQFNANPDGTFVDLPAKHVDTGMGFERVVSMIQGTKNLTDFSPACTEKISNYNTDVFRPLFDEIEKLTGKTYASTLPAAREGLTEQEKVDVAFRVIADHIRTLSFSIADGIQPSNEGRGYVLRRILRRAVKYGRNLGLKEPFLGKLVDVLGKTMGHIFPEVVAKAELIKKTLTNEEESFLRTLDRGMMIFLKGIAPDDSLVVGGGDGTVFKGKGLKVEGGNIFIGGVKDGVRADKAELNNISGRLAFELYDTYGFPLDLTELMAREKGLTVDVKEFERLMDEQRLRSQTAQKRQIIAVAAVASSEDEPTKFVGFDILGSKTKISRVDDDGDVQVVFSATETPFYATMGGQVSDSGTAIHMGHEFEVSEVWRNDSGIFWHVGRKKSVFRLLEGRDIDLQIDVPRRHKIEAHHSGTHLLNWALRKVLGNTITQKGSYVGPDRLRFDFSHGAAMTPAELAEVEKLVNEKIEADVEVRTDVEKYAKVKGDPTILQFFGDKYGEEVRVVSIGDFSKELCGGTHVRQSGSVGYFKILSESAIAAGVRRIEAASGDALRSHLEELLRKQEEQLVVAVDRRATVGSVATEEGTVARRSTATTDTLPHLWQRYQDGEKQLKDLAAQRAQHEKESAKQQDAVFQKRAAETAPDLIGAAKEVNGVPLLAVQVEGAPAAYLPVLADALKNRWQGVVVLATVDQGKVALLAAVAPAFTKKIQAGKIIQAIAPLIGGKGGGRPELAQGGGTNPDGLASALAKAEELVRG